MRHYRYIIWECKCTPIYCCTIFLEWKEKAKRNRVFF